MACLAGRLSGPPLKATCRKTSRPVRLCLAGRLSGPPLKDQELVFLQLTRQAGLAGRLSGPPLKALPTGPAPDTPATSGRTIVRPSIEGNSSAGGVTR